MTVCVGALPQGTLIKLLEEVCAQQQREQSHVYATENCLLFIKGKGNVAGAMADKEIRGLVSWLCFCGGLLLSSWSDGVSLSGHVEDSSVTMQRLDCQ